MSQENNNEMTNEEKWNAYWILVVVCGLAWGFLFIAIKLFPDNGGNLIFWSIVGGLVSPIGIFYEETNFRLDTPTIISIAIGLAFAFYITNIGYYNRTSSGYNFNRVESLLGSTLWFFVGWLSAGGAVSSLFSYIDYRRSGISQPKPSQKSNSSQRKKTNQKHHTHQKQTNDNEFGFKASRFRDDKERKRYEKWQNMASDPNASPAEREFCMRRMIEFDKN